MNNTANDKPIFTVTTFCYNPDLDRPISNVRTPGFYHEFDYAEADLINNCGDIWEYSYDYALIEEVKPGLYQACTNRHFFKFNISTKKYEQIPTPAGLKNVINFSIG